MTNEQRLVQTGPRDAKIVLVGEAPGGTENVTGIPFSGGAGEILDRMLDRCGIRRRDCFITNVCHVQPPDNKFEWFFKPANQIHYIKGVLQLKKDLADIHPNIAVALGGQALRVLTGKQAISKWRGSILESNLVPGLKVIGTYHPASIMRVYEQKAVAEMDLRRVKIQAAYPDIILPRREHHLNPTGADLERLVCEMAEALWLAVDIECWPTPDGKWRISCVGFSDRPGRSLVIHNDRPEALLSIRRLCACPAKKIYQNGSFDVTVLADEGIETTNFAWDTMLAHHAIIPECAGGDDEMSALTKRKRSGPIQKGLAFQASMYTLEPFYKDDGKLWKETQDLEKFWTYNGRDCAVTREIRDVQESEISALGVGPVFNRRMALIQPTLSSTRRGLRIDLEVRDALSKNIQAEIDSLQAALDEEAGETVNVKSWPQIRKLVYGKWGLPVKYKRGTSTVTSDKDALNELAAKFNHPALRAILKIRERRDLIERYLTASVDADGRMRCSFDITGTRSGRLSSRASIYGSGTNLQNIPARRKIGEAIRRMFIADPGKVLIVRDYSQAEVWIVAALARCEKLWSLLNDPTRDIHKETAAGIFNKLVSLITDIERYLAKRTVHSSNYGVGPEHLADKVNEDSEVTGISITTQEAARVIQGYFLLYPEIKENYWKDVERAMTYSRKLVTPLGMVREFYARWDDKLMRDAYSFIPQSTVGELGGMAWVNAYNQIELGAPETGTHILLNIHDALMAQADIEHVPTVVDRLACSMEIPLTIHEKTFTIPTDAKVGLNWAKASKDNPNGLRDWNKGGREWLETLKAS